MSTREPIIRNISDTARWTALYRARESERPDALFRDPFARQLAGDRGAQIAATVKFADQNAWSFTARTYLCDQLLAHEVREGVDAIVSLAAGLDTRPYRMELPAGLRWIEVDLPGILDYKEEVLRAATPRCRLERVRLDLSDVAARRALFQRIGSESRRVAVLCEGLLIYFPRASVATLAEDLAAAPQVERWITDLASAGLLTMMTKRMGREVTAAGAPFLFGPPEGPGFFSAHGWRPREVHPLLATAARLHRLPWSLRMWTWLPQGHPGPRSRRPWSGVVLLERAPAAAVSS